MKACVSSQSSEPSDLELALYYCHLFHELLNHKSIAATTIDEITRSRKSGKNNVDSRSP
jgi:hypothetical protein